MNVTQTLKSLGLYYSPNELTSQPGSLKVASNVIIKRDNIVQPRRGYRQYGTPFGTSSDTANQLFEYRTRILRQYDNILEWDTQIDNLAGDSVFQTFDGFFSEVQPGLRMKSVQSNGNFYFTTKDGIKKLSLLNDTGFPTAKITDAGGIKALNITTRLDVTLGSSSGFLPVNSAVAYRVLWLTKDVNKNLIRGVPSERSVVYNDLQSMIVRDMLQLLNTLDELDTPGSYINDGDYLETLSLPLGAAATTIQTNLIALANKLDINLGTLTGNSDLASASFDAHGICTVTFGSSYQAGRQYQIGDEIFLNNFAVDTGTAVDINGIQVVSNVANINGSSASFISFNVSASSASSIPLLTGNSFIEGGWFRSIKQPDLPNIPATAEQLQALQTYLQAIINELQTDRNVRLVASFGGVLNLTNVTASGTSVTLTTSPDLTTFVKSGDGIDLTGQFNTFTPSILGFQTLISSNSTSMAFSSTATGSYTGDSTDTIYRVIRFTNALQAEFINPLQVTTTANVIVDINIPSQVTPDYFFQIYRSDTITATFTDNLFDLVPDDEMRLVYEAFPTADELTNRFVQVEDITSDTFFQGGVFLYTNQNTGGEGGIAYANERPPLSTDVNRFKNVVFYANTSTLQRLQLTLLGVQRIIDDYDNNLNPSITIGDSTRFGQYNFVLGQQQITQVVCGSSTSITPSAYFTLNSASDLDKYYVWFDTTGSDTDPAPAGLTGIRVYTQGLSSADDIASRLGAVVSVEADDFITTTSSSTVTITNVGEGSATPAAIVTGLTTPFAITTTPGTGERIASQVTNINAIAGNLYKTSGTADYFTLNTPYGRNTFYFWFFVTGGTMTDPALSGRTGIKITVATADTANQVANNLNNIINGLTVLTSTVATNTVTITTFERGPTVDGQSNVANGSFTLTTTTEGALDVLLSSNPSIFIAVQDTAQSLVNVVNNDKGQVLNAFYISETTDVPGIINFEAKNLTTSNFYAEGNTNNVGISFNPSIAPDASFTNTAANPTVITAANHGLTSTNQIFIAGSTSFPSVDGLQTVTVIDNNTFTVPVNVLVSGIGSYTTLTDTTVSDNDVQPNRIFYSKLQQPEAVPLLNFFDVGDSDKQILRIFPLRDSLFVFKEDGLYRISGETAPFNLTLFDGSCKLVCPDSLALSNNFLYGYTKQGISAVSENGIDTVSRPIDNVILSLNTPDYVNFQTASWGIGYESDNSYQFNTVTEYDDTVATVTYRYSTLSPQTWTTYDKTNTCGIVKSTDDRLYLGMGDENILEQERKSFTRIDYSDHEIFQDLGAGNYLHPALNTMILSDVSELIEGDVIYQNQEVSIENFIILLKKLDIDLGVAPAYSITNATFASNVATLTLSTNVDSFLEVGDMVVVSGINPIGYNGTFLLTGIPASNQIQFALINNPGTFISSGTVKYSYADSLTPTIGSNLRDAITSLTAKLDIDPGLNESDFSSSTGDFSGSGVMAIAGNPVVISASNNGILTGRYLNIANSTTNPLINNEFFATRINNNSFSLPIQVLTSGTVDYETLVNDFNDIKGCYNIIVQLLNANTNTQFKDYAEITDPTPFETIIQSINTNLSQVTLFQAGLAFIEGPITIFKSYIREIEYLPTTFDGDFLTLKHFRECQLFFLNKAFTTADVTFASDLIPADFEVPSTFTSITLDGFGNGVFGNQNFGQNYFGGDSHSAPFRTYIPRNDQRSRFLRVGFNHQVARETFLLLGITLVGRSLSTRAYR